MGRRCPTTSTPRTCWRAACARTSRSSPGRAAFLDGRGGSSHAPELLRGRRRRDPRGRPTDRQGRAGAGQPLLDADRADPAAPARRRRRAPTSSGCAARHEPPVAVLKGGRSLERDGLAELRRARRGRAGAARPRGRSPSTSAPTSSPGSARRRPDVAFVALHGEDGEDGSVQELLELLDIPYTGSRPGACARSWDKVLAKDVLRDAGIPTPEYCAFNQIGLPRPRRRGGAAGDRAPPRLSRSSSSPRAAGPRSASSSRARTRTSRRALVAAFAYDTRILLERFVEGRELAVSLLDGEPLPVIEARAPGGAYDFEARYEIGRTEFVCPAPLPDDVAARAAGRRGRHLASARLPRLRARRSDARRGRRRSTCWRPTRSRASPTPRCCPQAADAAGVSFDDLVERILALA